MARRRPQASASRHEDGRVRAAVFLRATHAMAIAVVASAPVPATATPEPVLSEIRALMASLEGSGCEFHRNGSWYPARDARMLLETKLQAAGGTGFASAEQFIADAASRSSTSGRPYLVRCGGPQATSHETHGWLMAQLDKLRTTKGSAQGSRPPAASASKPR